MKNQSGVTILSLVVTIVILIILAGISINLILGEDGLIQKAKQAKENTELAQIEEQTSLNELYSVLKSEIGSSGEIDYDAITKLAEFKKAIADYIEEAGGVKPEYSAETITFGDSIKGILKEVTKNATATVDDIAEGKTAYVNGEMVTGTKENSKGVEIVAHSSYVWVVRLNGATKVTYTVLASTYNSVAENNVIRGSTQELSGNALINSSNYTKIGNGYYGSGTSTQTFEFGTGYKYIYFYCLKPWVDVKFE